MLYCVLPIKKLGARLLLGVIVSHTIVNLANQYSSGVFGPRYLYETTSSLIILTAAGIARIPLLLKLLRVSLPSRTAMHGIIMVPVVLVFAAGWTFNLPTLIKGFEHFFDNHPDFYYSLLQQSEKPALIFVGRGGETKKKYKWVTFTNPPVDNSPVIFALDRGDLGDHELMAKYPERHAYVEFKGQLIPFDVSGGISLFDFKIKPSVAPDGIP
jgi:hypothetical protein